MRYCNQCHRFTPGEPLYCSSCGATYNHKLCPSRHVNARTAEVCSECGSRDLSQPAPPLPLYLPPLLWLLSLLPGVVLALLLVAVAGAIISAILTNQQVQGSFLALLVLLGLLWFIYLHVPGFIKSLFKTLWPKTKKSASKKH